MDRVVVVELVTALTLLVGPVSLQLKPSALTVTGLVMAAMPVLLSASLVIIAMEILNTERFAFRVTVVLIVITAMVVVMEIATALVMETVTVVAFQGVLLQTEVVKGIVTVVMVVSLVTQVVIKTVTADVMTVRQVLMSVSDMPALSVMLPAIVGLQLHRK